MARDVLEAAAAATSREQRLLQDAYADGVELPDKLGAISAACTVFSSRGVAYALIGGLAVGIRTGIPRATLDVDFAIPTTIDRHWLAACLTQHGFRSTGEHAHSSNFQHESGEPVQLAFDAAFDPMIARAETLQFGALAIKVVTKDDLITMKRRAAADPQRRRSKALRDAADLALLEGDIPDPNEGW